MRCRMVLRCRVVLVLRRRVVLELRCRVVLVPGRRVVLVLRRRVVLVLRRRVVLVLRRRVVLVPRRRVVLVLRRRVVLVPRRRVVLVLRRRLCAIATGLWMRCTVETVRPRMICGARVGGRPPGPIARRCRESRLGTGMHHGAAGRPCRENTAAMEQSWTHGGSDGGASVIEIRAQYTVSARHEDVLALLRGHCEVM